MAQNKDKPGFSNKLFESQYKYRSIVFGFDQSYANTGIAIAGITNKGQIDIIHCESVPGISSTIKNAKQEYRKILISRICQLMVKYRSYGDNCHAIAESVRMHSDGNMMVNNHISWGALQGAIADALYQKYFMTLYVVDTRAWKSKVVGTSKPASKSPKGVDAKKWPTIEYVLHVQDVPKEALTKTLGPKTKNFTWLDKKGNKFTYDSDVADACCIAIYGLIAPITKLKMAP